MPTQPTADPKAKPTTSAKTEPLWEPLRHPLYRALFTAQITALIGTGLTTIALALLAYDLGGENAGAVLGIALALKMVTYVGLAPFAGAVVERIPRKRLLPLLDIIRAGVVCLLPFVDQIWQIMVLIVVVNACAALFTPSFQALIPDVLPEEQRYTRALSLARLAYDLEAILGPVLAALLIGLITYDGLFVLNGLTFLISAILILTVAQQIPETDPLETPAAPLRSVRTGIGLFAHTPRLRAVFALSWCVAAASATVIVQTVVMVRDNLNRPETDLAIPLAVAGAGSMLAALLLPRILARISDRSVMLIGATLGSTTLTIAAIIGTQSDSGVPGFGVLCLLWGLLGFGLSCGQVPVGRVLKRSSTPVDRPHLFAAQFALSHFCWLGCYPIMGISGALFGMAPSLAVAAVIAACGLGAAILLWPVDDNAPIAHTHPEQDHEHPHTHDSHHIHDHEGWEGPEPHRHPHYHAPLHHSHPVIIEAHHPRWPPRGPMGSGMV